MAVDISSAPFKLAIRELWLPGGINGVNLPSCRYNGHALTMTGARQGTTTDGVKFTGGATSYVQVVAEAGFNNQVKFVFHARLKFDQTFQTGVATQWLYNKTLVNEWIKIYFDTADGKLTFSQGDGAGGELFTLKSATQTVWTAGQWYQITCTLVDTAGGAQKLEVDGIVMGNGVAAARNTPNGGDSYIGNQSAPGAAGFIGTVSLVLADSVALTSAQLSDLIAGVPYATPVYFFPMDEGRVGLALTNRGSGGNNGTVGAANTWAYGRVKQPVLSPDGINDVATSSAGVTISGSYCFAWVGKMKSTYAAITLSPVMARIMAPSVQRIDLGVNTVSQIFFNHYNGANQLIADTGMPSIDDYRIYLLSFDAVLGIQRMWRNGSLIGSNTGIAPLVGAATGSLLASGVGTDMDVSKPLFCGLFGQAFSAAQALEFSRWLDKIFTLGLGI